MRTARNAGPSVGQSFDDEIDFGGDLCRSGNGATRVLVGLA